MKALIAQWWPWGTLLAPKD